MRTMTLKLTALGADNGAGEFERGGDLDVTEIEVEMFEDRGEQYTALCEGVAKAIEASPDDVEITPVRTGLWVATVFETTAAVIAVERIDG